MSHRFATFVLDSFKLTYDRFVNFLSGRYGAVEGLSSADCSGVCSHPLDCPLG
jgi:hypothetical protein